MVLTTLGVYQTAVTLFTLVIGARIWLARPGRFQNVALALVVILFGLMGFGSQGLMQLTTDPGLARLSQVLLYSLAAAVPFVYLAFVGTLTTPLARPFASRRARVALLGSAVLAGAATGAFIESFTGVQQNPRTALWVPFPKPAGLSLWYGVAAVVFYGFLAAISVVRRTPRGSPLRAQALIYGAAFGIRDTWYIATLLLIPHTLGTWQWHFLMYQFPTMTIVFTGLLAYGMLRYQILGVDLRIKWAISRATLATIFLALFFVVAVTAENFLTDRYGFLVGGGAAGLLLFALNPLQRFAERVANRAMPHVRNDAEYRLINKLEVYRAAYEGALQDGTITDRERDILARLQDELGITATEVLGVQRAVSAELGGEAGSPVVA